LSTIQKRLENLLPSNKSIDHLAYKWLGYKHSAIENMIESNLQIIKINGEYIAKSYEKYIAGIISNTEYQHFKRIFNFDIQTAKNKIAACREELICLNNKYAVKIIERLLTHKNIIELERCSVVRLVKSIVVSNKNEIKINLRY